ncbi:MAG TPA: hypothetical protein VJM34_09585 [Novosphingobium sp.]|nr:hypothetical protein [Novosphingobium sp.]
MRLFVTIAAASLAVTPAVAQSAEPCLTPAEFSALAGYAMPSVIAGATKRCAATLNGQSYLGKQGPALATRYAAHKDTSWPMARTAFLKFTSNGDNKADAILTGLPDTTLQQMLDGVVEGMVAQEIPLKDCSTIDKFVRLLAPLPPENTAELISLAVGLTSASDKSGKNGKVSKLNICPAGQ